MSVRKMTMLLAVAALGVCAMAAGTASASTFLRADPSGTALSSGATIMNGASDPFTVTFPGTGTLTCTTSTFAATVGASGGATVSATLDQLTIEGCTDTIPVINYTSCHAAATLPTITLTGTSATTGTILLADTTLFCAVSGTTSGCYYTMASASGAWNSSSVAFSNVSMTHTTGTGDLGSLCFTSGTVGVTWTDMTSAGSTVTLGNT
jgi:hypothetical protein